MPVKIDMEMPKACKDCTLSRYDEYLGFICGPTEKHIKLKEYWRLSGRPSWCPLQEVKE